MEYTNVVSQFLKSKSVFDEVKGSNASETLQNAKQKKAKFISPAVYLICTIIAVIIAWHYFCRVENQWVKYTLVVLAGVFNIPFLAWYAVVHVGLKHELPTFSESSSKLAAWQATRAAKHAAAASPSSLTESIKVI